jgi:CDP-glucose 4,6-dehydratase
VARLVNGDFWAGQRVLVTGHTGFKGSWLSLLLAEHGAEVHGLALDPVSKPNLYDAANVQSVIASDSRVDIRDLEATRRVISEVGPRVIFHLAAQPLVRDSYRIPVETFATNAMGVAHVLEAARETASVAAVVVVTTDKVYRNVEDGHAYREEEPLGGHDPYSASKAAAEIVSESYRLSFFSEPSSAAIATARAGNVIGGGDWSTDRLIPDCVRAFQAGEVVALRFPDAVRPWQHVLEPLVGYVALGEALLREPERRLDRAWNFGPRESDTATVGTVAGRAAALWGGAAQVKLGTSHGQPHEAGLLAIDSSLATAELGWVPRWDLETSVRKTIEWYLAWDADADMREFSRTQILEYLGADGA